MKKDLIIFADYGLDDAAATISIFKHRDNFKNITIVPIGGNVPVDMSFGNCFTLINSLSWYEDNLIVVDTRSVAQPSEYLAEIHGKDGMGDVFERNTSNNAVKTVLFEEWINKQFNNVAVLSLGPMTLVETFLRKNGECELILMGGCIDEEPNFNGYEFNQALDTAAFDYCVKYPHIAITLDTCRVKSLDLRDVDIHGDDMYSLILKTDQELSITRGEDGCYVWDDVAACYLLHPERFVLKNKKDKRNNIVTQAEYVSELNYFED